MPMSILFRLALSLGLILLVLSAGCSDDEGSLTDGIPTGELMLTEFRNPVEIEVNSDLQLALLLHDRLSPSGPTLQLVDLNERRVVASLILVNYFDAYDVAFISETEACFAGRPHGNTGNAVQFFELPSLNLTDQVMTSDTVGIHGYLDVDSAGSRVFYSHSGGGAHDAVYALDIDPKSLIDADNDGAAPYAFDNDLVQGLFDQPARIFFDHAADKIVVGNLNGNFISLIDSDVWGTLSRAADLVFPVPGLSHISTESGAVPDVRAVAVASGADIYAFAGMSGVTAYLSRFSTSSNGVDDVVTYTDRVWVFRNADIRIHPGREIVSLFVLQEDTSGVSIGQFGLNNLREVASSPYRTRHIADSTIAAVGIDIVHDRLIVADQASERLEFIDIEQ